MSTIVFIVAMFLLITSGIKYDAEKDKVCAITCSPKLGQYNKSIEKCVCDNTKEVK